MKSQKTILSTKDLYYAFVFIFCLIMSIVLLPSLTSARDKQSSKLTVYVVNYPLQYFAERIAGEHARVVFPAPPDEDPALWMNP